MFFADRDNVALHPRFHRVTFKNCANQYKQTEWRQRSEKVAGCCHNFAPKALQEAFLKVGQWDKMVKDMDLLKRSLSWDDYRSRSTLHQISMAFLTTVWSNLPLFLRFDAFLHLKNHVIISPTWLVNFTADSQSKKARKSRERADLANAGELNRRYLTCQISAILYPDRRDWRISQSPHRAHLAIFANHRDRRIKSPGVSSALALLRFFGGKPASALFAKE